MSDGLNQDGKDETLPPLLPPLISKSIPASLRRRYATDDLTPRGDQSIVLDEEDERILHKVWAEVARHPQMAVDPDAPAANGAHMNGRRKSRGHPVAEDVKLAEDGDATAVPRTSGASKH